MARSLTVAYPKITPPGPRFVMRYGPTASRSTPARRAAPITASSSRCGGSQVTRCSPAETPTGPSHGRCRPSAARRASRRRRYTGRIRLAQAGRHAGLWPVASEQTGTLLITLAAAVKSRQPLRIPVRALGLPLLVGASGMAATLAYFYATHFSMLAITAVLVSPYPGVTVLLARTLLHERFTPAQRAGLGLCVLAVAAIALN
jgi:uncharacterized membrane protein